LIPLNGGGVVLTSLELTTIDYAGYSLDRQAQAYASWIVGSNWLATVGQDYGVGPGTYVNHLTLDRPWPDTLTDTDIADLLESLLGVDGGLPEPNENSLYILYFPASTTITYYGLTSCVDFGGYHGEVASGSYDVPYAVIPLCELDISIAVSHELAEAATDPFVWSSPGYRLQDSYDPFSYITGGEVGDLCVGLLFSDDQIHYAQRIWSNEAAKAGLGSPCVPVPSDEVFVNVTPFFSGVQPVSAGTSVFQMAGWAGSPPPVGAWSIYAKTLSGIDASPILSKSTIADGDTFTLQINLPASAGRGATTVIEVSSVEPTNGDINYWPMIFQLQ
jgi:hypothetical protein